ncbi:hypothetical protein ACFO1V_01720 [Daeguia caeni]|uniref:Uncharacterized protein n=1 Tax=Daeguia caeni TaxID=439612 RepID=A0ABV9H3F0_9HYPH
MINFQFKQSENKINKFKTIIANITTFCCIRHDQPKGQAIGCRAAAEFPVFCNAWQCLLCVTIGLRWLKYAFANRSVFQSLNAQVFSQLQVAP